MSVDYALVLATHPDYAGRQWAIGVEYETLRMLDNGPKPTKAALEARHDAVVLARDTKAVREARRARYFAETDDLFWEAMRTAGNLTAWKAAVAKIKTDLPKPGAAK
jgi:hypothetical protein